MCSYIPVGHESTGTPIHPSVRRKKPKRRNCNDSSSSVLQPGDDFINLLPGDLLGFALAHQELLVSEPGLLGESGRHNGVFVKRIQQLRRQLGLCDSVFDYRWMRYVSLLLGGLYDADAVVRLGYEGGGY